MYSTTSERKDTGMVVGIFVALLLIVGALVFAAQRGFVPEPKATAAIEAPAENAVATALTVPGGTEMTVEFVEPVSSETHSPGDSFTAIVRSPVTEDGQVAVHAGDTIVGTIVEAVPAEASGKTASLRLQFEALRLSTGEELPLSAQFVFVEAEQPTTADAEAEAVEPSENGTVVGHLVARDSDLGEADQSKQPIGTAVERWNGTAIVAAIEGDPVVIRAGTLLGIRVESPLQVPVS